MIGANLFFRAFELADKLLSTRKLDAHALRAQRNWQETYQRMYPDGSGITIISDHPVALESDDHILPRGTALDSSTNRRFNQRLKSWFCDRTEISILDLGCAGGGFVRTILEDGHLAVGLEGSDYSSIHRSGEWGICKHHLFTCDITKPFRIERYGECCTFDLITAWEVLEHIPEDQLDTLIANIADHLKPNGYFIGSVDTLPDGNPLKGAVYHVTLNDKQWWLNKFRESAFEEIIDHPFVAEDYVRGNGLTIKDWHPSAGDAFHLVVHQGK